MMEGTPTKLIGGPLDGEVHPTIGNRQGEVHFPGPKMHPAARHVYKYDDAGAVLIYCHDDIPPDKCGNPHCAKPLTTEDFPVMWGDHPMHFGQWHLCRDCFARFDGQKMRGRFRAVGLSHDQLVALGAQMDQETSQGCVFNIGHPSEEGRCTESLTEWIGWQNPESNK